MADNPRLRFNEMLVLSIDEAIQDIFGKDVVAALHEHLNFFYDVHPEEIPYRIDTLELVLEKNFGKPFKILERAIAKKLYSHLTLPFAEKPNYTLQDYLAEARSSLSILPLSTDHPTLLSTQKNVA